MEDTERPEWKQTKEFAYPVVATTHLFMTKTSFRVTGIHSETGFVNVPNNDTEDLMVYSVPVQDEGLVVPRRFLCPTSHQVMMEPVIGPDGSTRYDKSVYPDGLPDPDLAQQVATYIQQRRWWKSTLSSNDVVVISAKVLLDFLHRGLLGLNEFDTLVFNDCKGARNYSRPREDLKDSREKVQDSRERMDPQKESVQNSRERMDPQKENVQNSQERMDPQKENVIEAHPVLHIMDDFYSSCSRKPRIVGLLDSPIDSHGFAIPESNEQLMTWITICRDMVFPFLPRRPLPLCRKNCSMPSSTFHLLHWKPQCIDLFQM